VALALLFPLAIVAPLLYNMVLRGGLNYLAVRAKPRLRHTKLLRASVIGVAIETF